MKISAEIIKIGNSRGIRLPKKMLEEAKLSGKVMLEVEGGKIIISPERAIFVNEEALMAESVLARDWNRPEEDEAWASLQ